MGNADNDLLEVGDENDNDDFCKVYFCMDYDNGGDDDA